MTCVTDVNTIHVLDEEKAAQMFHVLGTSNVSCFRYLRYFMFYVTRINIIVNRRDTGKSWNVF
jgi:hypothetical protein